MKGKEPYDLSLRNAGRAEALGRMALRLEGGLTPTQKQLAREIAAEIFSRVIQEQAPGPTTLLHFDDVFDLTQTALFVEWQEKALHGPRNVVHPGHYVLRHMIQMQQTDITLQAILGYLYNSRKVMGQALDNLKGVTYEVIRSLGGEVTQLLEIDKEGRGWTAYTSATTPDSVVLRRARYDKGKAKREHDRLKRKHEDELRARGTDVERELGDGAEVEGGQGHDDTPREE